jgi:diguanylate cyclase
MPKLTRRVLERSLRTLARWRATGHEWAMSVNLPASVLSDAELVDEVARLLTETGLPGSALQLEITEDTLMADSDRAAMVLARFHEHGVRFAIDDYGTGHSSLARLKSLPISELKIDRSFVTNMLDEPEDAMIVRSTVNLAHDLGLEVVAEGVEDHGVFEALRRLHCDRAQGFFLSCALDPSDVPGWLAQWEERRLRLLAA